MGVNCSQSVPVYVTQRCGSLWVVVDRCGIVVGRCGSLWIVVGRCGSFRVLVTTLANYCHTVNKALLSFFCLKTLTLALKCFCWCKTFAELLWSTWLMWQTSADLWKFCIHLWTHSSFQLFCSLYKSSISHCLSLLFAAIQTLSAICLKTDYVFLPFHGSLPYYRHM